jgi:hypothetical protein
MGAARRLAEGFARRFGMSAKILLRVWALTNDEDNDRAAATAVLQHRTTSRRSSIVVFGAREPPTQPENLGTSGERTERHAPRNKHKHKARAEARVAKEHPCELQRSPTQRRLHAALPLYRTRWKRTSNQQEQREHRGERWHREVTMVCAERRLSHHKELTRQATHKAPCPKGKVAKKFVQHR